MAKSKRTLVPGWRYNRLDGKAREWAIEHGMPTSEFTTKAIGGKRFRGPRWQKQKCGFGVFGFPTRRTTRNLGFTETLDGGLKRARPSVVKSGQRIKCRYPCRLINNSRLALLQADPLVVEQKIKEDKKLKRRKNRNHRARRGHRASITESNPYSGGCRVYALTIGPDGEAMTENT